MAKGGLSREELLLESTGVTANEGNEIVLGETDDVKEAHGVVDDKLRQGVSDRSGTRGRLGTLRVITLNVNGIRDDEKKLALGMFIHATKAQVYILTETHLTKEEARGLNYPSFWVANESSLVPDQAKMRGGVAILVHTDLGFQELPTCEYQESEVLPPLYSCSVLVHLLDGDLHHLRITGVYFPPKNVRELAQVARMTEPRNVLRVAGEEIGRLIAGDFNHMSWTGIFDLWLAKHGLLMLSDPSKGTYHSGNALDKFLFLPGNAVPFSFLPECLPTDEADGGDASEELFYPAVTFPAVRVGNHHPVQLDLPLGVEVKAKAGRTLKIKSVSREQWEEIDGQVRTILKRKQSGLDRAFERNDSTHLHMMVVAVLAAQLRDHYSHKKRGSDPEEDPFTNFCRKNRHHKLLGQLLTARVKGQKEKFATLLRRIKSDSWKGFLAKIQPAEISKIYKFMQKADGRKPKVFRYQCSHPLVKDGQVYSTGQARCDLLGEYFESRLNEPDFPARQRDWLEQVKKKQTARNKGGRGKKSAPKYGKGGGPKGGGSCDQRLPRRPSCLSGHRREMTGELLEVTCGEVAKAVKGLAVNKVAGPDGFPVDVFAHLPSIYPALARMYTIILKTGRIPQPLLELEVVPFDKPGKDPADYAAKRPISLICAMAKILEGIVLHRMMPALEPRLGLSQYAYRRQRGTEFHLVELTEFVRVSQEADRLTLVASLDIAGAFDTIPHQTLLDTIMQQGVEAHLCRYIRVWLTGRRFRLRLATPQGVRCSGFYGVSRGVPQGGVLSPFLWLLLFDRLDAELQAARRGWEEELRDAEILFLFYADDIAFLVSHADPEILARAARRCAEEITRILRTLGLVLQQEKSFNLVVSPGDLIHGIFRRGLNLSRSARMDLGHREEQLRTLNRAGGEQAQREHGIFPESLESTLPFKTVSTIKILGVVFDTGFGFTAHVEGILQKVRLRHGIMARLARSTWGLEAGLLRSTHAALLTSLMGYGLAVVGSGAYEKDLRRLGTQGANVTARRITGISRSARLEVLHAAAGIWSIHNQYLQHVAMLLARALAADRCSLRDKLDKWLQQTFSVETWVPNREEIQAWAGLRPRTVVCGIHERDLQERWYHMPLAVKPKRGGVCTVGSVYHADTKIFRDTPLLKAQTYTFGGVQTWYEIGLQILLAADWRPDCTRVDQTNIKRSIPPRGKVGAPLVFGGTSNMTWQSNEEREMTDALLEGAGRRLDVEVQSFLEEGWGISCSYMRTPGGVVSTQGCLLGMDPDGKVLPDYVEEYPGVHALELVRAYLSTDLAANGEEPEIITIRAGGPLLVSRLLDWCNRGALRLQSAAASAVVGLFHELSEVMCCPLVFCSTDGRGEYRVDPALPQDGPRNVITITKNRFFQSILPRQTDDWYACQSRIPLTTKEIQARVVTRFERDEGRVLKLLAEGARSVSCGIYERLGLTRAIIRDVLEVLRDSRILQSTFCSIICATRFKYFYKGVILPTICQYCGQVDSLSHLIACVNIGDVPRGDEDELRDYLVELSRRANNVNPNYPVPQVPGDGVEICLVQHSDSEDEGMEECDPQLDFEDDSVLPIDLVGLATNEETGAGGGREHPDVQ